jgi:hypothetical protein
VCSYRETMNLSISAQLAAQASRRRRVGPLRALLFLLGPLLALLFLPMPAAMAAELAPRRWSLPDEAGTRWGLSLFSQPDPDYPPGLRLRLQSLSGSRLPDHHAALRLRDAAGTEWILPNRSGELVPLDQDRIPDASAQFDAGALEPRPSDVLPIRLSVPLVGGDDATALLVLPPDAVQALHEG